RLDVANSGYGFGFGSCYLPAHAGHDPFLADHSADRTEQRLRVWFVDQVPRWRISAGRIAAGGGSRSWFSATPVEAESCRPVYHYKSACQSSSLCVLPAAPSGRFTKGVAMPARKRHIRHAEIVRLFAARLRELRHSRGLTQAELASQAHVTVS